MEVFSAKANLADATTRDDVVRWLRSFLAPYSFTAFAAGFLPDSTTREDSAAGTFLLLDWPRDWLELYASRGFATTDVLLAEAAMTSEPFTWSEVRARRPGVGEDAFAAACDFGWSDGFLIPVHNPRGRAGERLGVISLAASRLDDFDARARREVTSVCLQAFAHARRLKKAVVASALRLTRREREVLALVADGLSDGAIAARLGVAPATAHYHIESGKRRLGASTRAQAVAIAITQNLL